MGAQVAVGVHLEGAQALGLETPTLLERLAEHRQLDPILVSVGRLFRADDVCQRRHEDVDSGAKVYGMPDEVAGDFQLRPGRSPRRTESSTLSASSATRIGRGSYCRAPGSGTGETLPCLDEEVDPVHEAVDPFRGSQAH